jgi:hypothetical protein
MKDILKHTKELLENENVDEHFNDPNYYDGPVQEEVSKVSDDDE